MIAERTIENTAVAKGLFVVSECWGLANNDTGGSFQADLVVISCGRVGPGTTRTCHALPEIEAVLSESMDWDAVQSWHCRRDAVGISLRCHVAQPCAFRCHLSSNRVSQSRADETRLASVRYRGRPNPSVFTSLIDGHDHD